MFENPGKELKIVAIVLAPLGFIGAIVMAIIMGKASFGLGLLYFLLIALSSFVSSLTLYCFGEITERVDGIDLKAYYIQTKQQQMFQKQTNIEKEISNINKIIGEKE